MKKAFIEACAVAASLSSALPASAQVAGAGDTTASGQVADPTQSGTADQATGNGPASQNGGLAQNAEDTGDIIVTANRTSSLLSQTPIAITAVSGSQLVQAGITNPTQLDEVVPNLSIARNNGLQITIRGVTSSDNTEKGDPSAAFMLNGAYIARPQAQEVSFYDIERVEVLRGPQGTLYGRNSTAGVINVLSARPNQEFGASIDTSYASFNDSTTTGVVNIPVTSTLAVRAAANYDRRDNFIIDGNRGDGISLDPFKENLSGRLSLLFKPTSRLSVYLVGDYSKIKGVFDYTVPVSNFYTNVVTGVRPTFERPTYVDTSSRRHRVFTNRLAQQGRRDSDDAGITGEVSYDLGPATLTYLGSYRDFNRNEYQNYAEGAIAADFFADYWQTSHEVRAALSNTGPLQAQVGGYYFKEKSSVNQSLYNLLGPNTGFQFLRDPTISENKSAFGQATYEIVSGLRLTGGVRYSQDTKSRVGSTVQNQYTSVVDAYTIGRLLTSTTLETTAAKRDFSKVTWRAGVDYDSSLGLIFASVSTGYKAGGFNDGCEAGSGPGCTLTAAALYYDPETLTAYEAGFKFRFGSAFRLTGTVFHYDYSDLQLTQTQNICGPNANLPCTVTRNAAVAKVDGVELESQIKPTDNFSVGLGFNYLDARYDSFVPAPGVNLAGRSLNRSPKIAWTAGVNYWIPIGDGRLTADANTRFSSRYDLADLGNYAYFQQPSFTKTDLSLTYSAAKDRFYVGAFVKNLENNVVVTSALADGFNGITFADPRQFGVRSGIKF